MRKDSAGYSHYNHSVGLATVHLVWIPKRRKPVLKGEIAKRCRAIITEVALEKDWELRALEVAPDHIHLFVTHRPDESVAQVVRAFKGRTSRLLRQEFPQLRKLPSLWTRSYWYTTSGNVSNATIQQYINDPHHCG